MRVQAIVLAAGAGTRIGAPKATLVWKSGRTFVEEALESLSRGGVAPPFAVVLDPGSPAFWPARQAMLAFRVRIVENADAAAGGMLSSIVAGLDALEPDATHAALLPVDHVGIFPSTVAALLAAAAARPDAIVVPSFGSRRGHPAIFPRALFAELRAAPPSEGARVVLRADPSRVEHVVVDDPRTVRDVDTPGDL